MTKYVGEQLENTGPSDAPIRMELWSDSPSVAFWSEFWALWLKLNFMAIISHHSGTKRKIPKIRTIPPETVVQKTWGMSMRRDEALSSSEKTTMLSASEPVTISGFHGFLDPAVLPIITGSKGKTQGANIVRAPARNDVPSKTVFMGFGG